MPSVATTNVANSAALRNPAATNPFRPGYAGSTALTYGPSLPKTMQNMLPTPNDRRGLTNRDDLNRAMDQINYLLKAAPQLLPNRNVASTTIGDRELSLNDCGGRGGGGGASARNSNNEQLRNRSNANSGNSRNDKPAHRAERSFNNDRRGRRGNSPTPSSALGRAGSDRRNDDRERSRNYPSGRRR